MLTNSNLRKHRGQPLPRGRHGLSPGEVKTSQKARLVRAMLDLVVLRGYNETSVPDVVAHARVSRNAFYEFFPDKETCFLEACYGALEELASEMLKASTGKAWTEKLRNGLIYYLNWWQDRPGMTRTYFVEMPTAGGRAIRQRDFAYAAFEKIFFDLAQLARHQQKNLPPLRAFVPRMLAISITEMLAAEVRLGHTHRLTDLRNDLEFYLIKLIADDATAQRAAAP